MADNLEEKRTKRLQLMKAVYEKTNGDTAEFIQIFDLGTALGWSTEETARTMRYLMNERLLKEIGYGTVVITHQGVVEVEAALARPEKPTEHFPAANVIIIGSMSRSAIQQGTVQSTQSFSMGSETKQQLAEFIDELIQKLPEIPMNEEDRMEVRAEAETIRAQLSSSRPKSSVIAAGLRVIRDLLVSVAGSVIAAELLQKTDRFFSLFQ